jgi:molybdate transport system ATP-binding protein
MERTIFFAEVIEIKNVEIVKAGKVLFKDFSWRIARGENWIIDGPNGSGKTLLLEMLSGMTHVPHGEIYYDFIKGKSWDERFAEKRALITYIPAYALRLFVSGHDLFYQQRYYSMDDSRESTVKEILGEDINKLNELDIPEDLSIAHLLDVEVSRLSNGQLKKLLIVKSFLKGIPRLLLLDYPFEGLDRESREKVSAFVDFVSQRHGVQVIVIDHQYLPGCINRRLTLNNFSVESVGQAGTKVKVNNYSRQNLPQPDPTFKAVELIRINNLNLKYGHYVVFKSFSWVVHKGERWALTGRNGAGKTTLFSLIFADHPQAYAQEIFLFGKRRGSGESIWDIKKRINYLGPEQVTFLDSKSQMLPVQHYVKMVVPGFDNERFQHLVRHFDADLFIYKRVNTLSSGELQLLMIFICFLSEKELWLLDEPFQFLDCDRKEQLAKYLSTHISREVTLILITHNDDDLAEWTEKRMQL